MYITGNQSGTAIKVVSGDIQKTAFLFITGGEPMEERRMNSLSTNNTQHIEKGEKSVKQHKEVQAP